jgi:threonylcarbamoyladenosine tRNA methylthiotransferase MtaB
MNKIDVITFGCRLNAYESEVIRTRAMQAGLEDAVIVNTCAVTKEAVRQSRQAVRKLKRESPNRQVIVTGCAAQIEPETFASMPEVDRVLGNEEKLSAANYTADFLADAPRVLVNDIMAVTETAGHFLDAFTQSSFENRTRAVLSVQNGCNHRCTFCVIPYGRGNSRSVGAGAVVAEAQRLVEAGFKEIVLSGVDLTAYGADLPGQPTLGALAARILKHVPDLKRLRLSSIDSIEADETLLRLIAEEERLMPHLHLSVQSGDDLILKRMKRRHLRGHTVEFCHLVRRLRPDVAFGADLIVGFPTESEAMFQRTISLVDEAGLSYLHVFPFSPRPGTPAARMRQVPNATIKERARLLRATGQQALAARLGDLIGTRQAILIEKQGFGRTPCFAMVAVDDPAARAGSMTSAVIVSRDERTLRGRVLKAAAKDDALAHA